MKVLAFLAGEDEALGRFLTLSGIHPQDLRERVDDPLLLAAVLDFCWVTTSFLPRLPRAKA